MLRETRTRTKLWKEMSDLRKTYMKPTIEIEVYSLSASIASNCGIVVSNGPAMGTHPQCDDYVDPFGGASGNTVSPMATYNVQFYEDTNCDCYYSASDFGYWMS